MDQVLAQTLHYIIVGLSIMLNLDGLYYSCIIVYTMNYIVVLTMDYILVQTMDYTKV